MTTPDEQPDAEKTRAEAIDTLQATAARLDPARAHAGSPALAARMDEAGWLIMLAASLLGDPQGSVHCCAACGRSDRPMRPLGQLAGGGPCGTSGLQWACKESCLIYIMMR
jgi:hypothetical protein